MSIEDKQEEWDNSLADQTLRHTDACLLNELGKSPSVDNPMNSCSETKDIQLERLKLQQDAAEAEFNYQLKRLEIERQIARTKYEREIAQLSASTGSDYVKVDEEVKINKNIGSCSVYNHHHQLSSDSNYVNEIICKLDLPKLELSHFDGDSSQYHHFIKEFETQIESRVTSDRQRLSYLLHYCTGRAKRAISGCVILPGSEGYINARKILSNMFGQAHVVAKSLLDKITSGKPVKNTSDDLWELSIEMQNCKTTLTQMSYVGDLNSHMTIERVARRLPYELQKRWVERASEIYDDGREPIFQDLIDFVVKRARVAGCRYNSMLVVHEDKHRLNNQDIRKNKEFSKNTTSFNSKVINSVHACPLCKTEHSLDVCPVFTSMNVSSRWRYVLRSKRCLVCLSQGHLAINCDQRRKCSLDGCIELHHELLHKAKADPSFSVNATESTTQSSVSKEKISLGIVAVKVVGPKCSQLTYALVDNGADSTFISENLAERLGLEGVDASVTVKTLNSVKSEKSSKVAFLIEPFTGEERIKVEQAFTIPNLNLGIGNPLSTEQLSQWKHLADVKLVSIGQSEIEILIGCNTPEVHWTLDQRIGNRQQPFAVKTVLGWSVFGPMGSDSSYNNSKCFLSSCDVIEQQIKKLYDNEFEDVSDSHGLSSDDLKALKQVSDSILLKDGHFVVGFPWKLNKDSLPDNLVVAQRRLSLLKKRFTVEPNLYDRYSELIQRHLDLGYASMVPDTQLSSEVKWFLPHHPVLNPKKPGKVRIVFDCAAKYKGVSLNDCLLQGPNMVQNLVAVLTRFRKGTYALTGDIQEMFLQVRVPEEDRCVLRFLWWEKNDMTKQIREFQLNVHPFGAVSSPFCASFALQRCIHLYNGKFEHEVANILKRNFYVDDCLISCDSEQELDALRNELSELLRLAGFHLTKWNSNSSSVLANIHSTEHASLTVNMSLDGSSVERTLGMLWDVEADCFKFDVHLPERPMTRRGMLSCVSSLYDPLGLVAPILLPAKQILQELCRRKTGWDDRVDDDIVMLWKRWLRSVELLRDIRIRRQIKPSESNADQRPELHLFSDASEKGYGVAAYVRYATDGNNYRCSLLFGKSRVTPLKTISIPRLELTAAVLAVKVASLIFREELIIPSKTFYWTDSTTVLYYLTNTSSRYATFVANRVSYILEHCEREQWLFVNGSENPADYASRGLTPEDPKFKVWLEGPEFMKSSLKPLEYPQWSSIPDGCEFKRVHTTCTYASTSPLNALLMHYSSWAKLQRAVVWLTRYKTYLMVIYSIASDAFVPLGTIKVEELERATSDIITLVQMEVFSSEINELRKFNKCKRLAKLNPVLKNGMLMLSGRLERLTSLQPACRPILPSRHWVTELIVKHYHEMEGHAGMQQVLNTLHRHFWILKGAATVRRVLNRCVKCKRLNAKPVQQQMAQLPISRISPGTYAFEACGVDYFGPVLVHQGRTTMKRWGCLFTCMRTRAVHIEIAYSLSTDSFLMALLRFINRRGYPKEIFSDNGSNFVGAENELRKELRSISQEKISSKLSIKGIQWHFNPPGTSHRGGVWERLIRSMRKTLRAITNGRTLRDEVLLTAMTEVERILNNRPLVPVYDDARDPVALTPNDLILLRPIEPVTVDSSLDLRRYTSWWKQAWHLSNIFWKRWVSEYLPTLELRQKWFFPKRNLKVGDVVLVTSDIGSKDDWPLGRVVAVHPGDDGLVRKVDVITKKGKLHRDIRKLCLLEGDTE